MREYPGYQPWWAGGDPWPTYAELQALVESKANRDRAKAREARKSARAGRTPRSRPVRRRR